MARIYVEGYGCSMNLAETDSILGHAVKNGLEVSESPETADFIVINTCAVKERTEFRMLSRIKELASVAGNNSSQLVVFGCLPKVSHELIDKVSGNALQLGPDLEALSEILGIDAEPFSPSVSQLSRNSFVTVLPICSGCTNYCTFCGTKLARGNIKSYPIESVKRRLESGLATAKEFWLTGQDTGAYGLDTKSSLPMLLDAVLSVEGDFRVRIGMMNPHHLKRIYSELVPFFSDRRLYKFLHIPLQSGSDRVLKVMRRGYTAAQYKDLVSRLRKDVPGITIATDIIVGFPGETEEEFMETVSAIKETEPDVTNISRFGTRPGTIAAGMQSHLSGPQKKERSKLLTPLCRLSSFQRNRRMLGSLERIYVSEEGPKGGFMGRTSNYKPVIIKEDLRGSFIDVEVTATHPTYLEGRVLHGIAAEQKVSKMPFVGELKVRGLDY